MSYTSDNVNDTFAWIYEDYTGIAIHSLSAQSDISTVRHATFLIRNLVKISHVFSCVTEK